MVMIVMIVMMIVSGKMKIVVNMNSMLAERMTMSVTAARCESVP